MESGPADRKVSQPFRTDRGAACPKEKFTRPYTDLAPESLDPTTENRELTPPECENRPARMSSPGDFRILGV